MKKTALLALAFAVCACAPAQAQTQPNGERLLERMKDADANHDGAVTRAEFMTYRATQFDRLDRNHDGCFTPGDIPQRLAKRVTARTGVDPDQMISMLDKDGDGKVSKDEFVNGPTMLFDRVDANGEGKVTADELEAARAALAARASQ
ncbi:MAG: signal transduction protein [Alphaproteobacteria bacterium]|nr:signal transduction protein [Alphaproteobacteria bacterium]